MVTVFERLSCIMDARCYFVCLLSWLHSVCMFALYAYHMVTVYFRLVSWLRDVRSFAFYHGCTVVACSLYVMVV